MNREECLNKIRSAKSYIACWIICALTQIPSAISDIQKGRFPVQIIIIAMDIWLICFYYNKLKKAKQDLFNYDHEPKEIIP